MSMKIYNLTCTHIHTFLYNIFFMFLVCFFFFFIHPSIHPFHSFFVLFINFCKHKIYSLSFSFFCFLLSLCFLFLFKKKKITCLIFWIHLIDNFWQQQWYFIRWLKRNLFKHFKKKKKKKWTLRNYTCR